MNVIDHDAHYLAPYTAGVAIPSLPYRASLQPSHMHHASPSSIGHIIRRGSHGASHPTHAAQYVQSTPRATTPNGNQRLRAASVSTPMMMTTPAHHHHTHASPSLGPR